MKLARAGHGVIYDGYSFIVVGGSNEKSGDQMVTEKCEWNYGNFTCEQQEPGLSFFVYYPELFLVHDDYELEKC